MKGFGVGTELKRLLAKMHIYPIPECLCNQRSIIMNEQGPKWCRDNISTIVEWLQEEADKREMLFSPLFAKLLVLLAIRNARKKERIFRVIAEDCILMEN